MKIFTCFLYVFIAIFSLNLSIAYGKVIIKDDFNYPFGPLEGNTGGIGWSGPWLVWGGIDANATVARDSFREPAGYHYPLSGRSVRIAAGSRTIELRRLIASPISLSPEKEISLYFSLFFSRTSLNTGGEHEQVSFLFLRDSRGRQMINFGADTAEALTILTREATTGVAAEAKMDVGSAYRIGSSFGVKTQYFVLGKMILRPRGILDEFCLSIYPVTRPIPARAPASWDVTLEADTSGMAHQIYLTSGTGAGVVNVINLYIGVDYRDVVSGLH